MEHEIPDDPTITPDDKMEHIIRESIGGIEAENSLWKARDMPDYDVKPPLKTKDVTAPKIWIKEEDWRPLREWNEYYSKPIWIVQVFYDEAFMTSSDWLKSKVKEIIKVGLKGRESSELQKKIGVLVVHQQYSDSTSGASQTKLVFTVLPSIAVKFGYSIEEPDAVPRVMFEDNGKIIPYVRFEGGRLKITESAVRLLLGEKML